MVGSYFDSRASREGTCRESPLVRPNSVCVEGVVRVSPSPLGSISRMQERNRIDKTIAIVIELGKVHKVVIIEVLQCECDCIMDQCCQTASEKKRASESEKMRCCAQMCSVVQCGFTYPRSPLA